VDVLRRRWVPVVIAACVAFYVGLYFWGMHSEGYQFLDQAIRKSPAIQQRVGDVQNVRMSFLGGYRERFVGSNKSTTMTLVVVGSKGTVTVKAAAKKANGTWSVSAASSDGERVTLN